MKISDNLANLASTATAAQTRPQQVALGYKSLERPNIVSDFHSVTQPSLVLSEAPRKRVCGSVSAVVSLFIGV